MKEPEHTVRAGPDRATMGRSLSQSAAEASPNLVVVARAAIGLASALRPSRSTPRECH